MTIQSDAAKAEQLTRRRARMLPVLAVLFLGQQVSYFGSIEGNRAVDHVKISAWIVLSIVLLLALTTGGGWIYSKQVRDLANDESTRAHRADAFRWGFVAAMGACILMYAVSLFEVVGGREAVHVVMTIGIATALVRFGWLERRASRD
jgi:Na+-driven multidrug efflux pump